MPYLSDAQRNLLAPAVGAHPRNGSTVPGTDQPPLYNAACWAWALVGEYENVDGAFTANTIYSGDAGAFVFNAARAPIGLNQQFFETTDAIFPDSQPYHQILNQYFAAGLAGSADAQNRCRVALMKLTAIVNGINLLPDGGSDVYTIVMNTNSWYGWDHWALGIKGAAAPVITYQQKVNETPVQYNCGVAWDEHQPLVTTIRIDGLQQAQVNVLNRVV
jgi:hypothetical protein